MTLKRELNDYRARWAVVEARQALERRSASVALRWQQLNVAFAMGKSLGFKKSDASIMEVYQKWAKLKEKFDSPHK